MTMQSSIKLGIAAVFCHLMIASGASASENEIENPLDTVNKHFEVASKDFGGGVTQLHARKDGADGSEHSIYHFDCPNLKYALISSSAGRPDNLPDVADEPFVEPLEPDDIVAPLAQHTCAKYGYPLLEW
ncbi:hypothetical protein M3P21_10525 [Ruegeria sp. 2012CJ41-6]|uniref:Uncharacterized protein n=1 Tax=Ruegeria spongiae TaxID=2942209 RepID=A0ABT0Q2A1_9RHOB|nr:hypothetical protein [Ruegeria spongiae]MCL6283965.1 hypothetical protein [Ruegeria spongiae]